MKTSVVLLLWPLALVTLANCGGTDTGNALSGEVVVNTSSDTVPTAITTSEANLSEQPMAANDQPLSNITLSAAKFYIRQVAIPNQSSCSDPLPARSSWAVVATHFLLDWLSDVDTTSDLSLTKNSATCQLRLIAAASSDLATPSIDIEGVTSGGTNFTLKSFVPHLFVLKTSALKTFATDDDAKMEVVFYMQDVFTGAAIDALGENPATITPASHPVLFAAMLKKIRRNLRAHPFKRVGAAIEKHRETVLGQGDESAEDLETGETPTAAE